jgi:hypothetical protein
VPLPLAELMVIKVGALLRARQAHPGGPVTMTVLDPPPPPMFWLLDASDAAQDEDTSTETSAKFDIAPVDDRALYVKESNPAKLAFGT